MISMAETLTELFSQPQASEYLTDIGRLVLAAACGAVVGVQREHLEKAAGLRTHMLLAIGACLFTLVVIKVHPGDITRVMQGIVTGAGFLGGGVIFREGASVRGLTTAAGLWVMSAVGLAIGTGQYFIGILATLITFVILSVLLRVEAHIRKSHAKEAAKDPPGDGDPPAGGDPAVKD